MSDEQVMDCSSERKKNTWKPSMFGFVLAETVGLLYTINTHNENRTFEFCQFLVYI